MNNKKAFTLVELLAVIVILAVVLAIAIPRISNIIESAERSSFVSSTKLLIKAVQTKLLEDNNFDIKTINKSNMETLLRIPDDNYESVSFNRDIYGKIHTNIAGEGKWNNLTTYGTYEDINIKNTENIVTDGLVLHLDAGNPISFPKSGTIWNDISGNGYNGTLVNGVGYNFDNSGSLVFDGLDDVVDFGNTLQLGLESRTYNVWYKFSDLNTLLTTSWLITKTDNGGTPFRQALGFNDKRDILYVFSDSSNYHYGNSGSSNPRNIINPSKDTNYHMITWVIDRNGFSSIYFDAEILDQIDITPIKTQNFSLNRNLRIGSYSTTGNNPMAFFGGNIPLTQIYNRALSANEIEQNYSALKHRYGL